MALIEKTFTFLIIANTAMIYVMITNYDHQKICYDNIVTIIGVIVR